MTRRLRIAAALLLLLFSLKMGTGLLLHELLHDPVAATSPAAELDFACHCIDDFNCPFSSPAEIGETRNFWFPASFEITRTTPLHLPPFRLMDLRGPPAVAV